MTFRDFIEIQKTIDLIDFKIFRDCINSHYHIDTEQYLNRILKLLELKKNLISEYWEHKDLEIKLKPKELTLFNGIINKIPKEDLKKELNICERTYMRYLKEIKKKLNFEL